MLTERASFWVSGVTGQPTWQSAPGGGEIFVVNSIEQALDAAESTESGLDGITSSGTFCDPEKENIWVVCDGNFQAPACNHEHDS